MKTLRSAGAGLLAVLALAGCEDLGSGPEAFDDSAVTLDVATVAADAVVDDVLGMALGTTGAPLLGVTGGPAAVPGGQGQGPGGQGQGGQGQGQGGKGGPGHQDMARSHTVTFYDAAGNVMEAYDAELTASINIVTEMSGTRETPRWTREISRHSDRTVSGLEGDETQHTWNGTGSMENDRVRFDDVNGNREYHMSSTSTTEDVVVALPRDENPWPLSGTITRIVKVSIVNGPNGDVEEERTVVVTFNGTQFVTMTVDGEAFEIDLADRQGRTPQRKGIHG